MDNYAGREFFKFVQDIEAQHRQAKQLRKTQEADDGEEGLIGGDLLAHRIVKILKRLESLVK